MEIEQVPGEGEEYFPLVQFSPLSFLLSIFQPSGGVEGKFSGNWEVGVGRLSPFFSPVQSVGI